MVSLNGYLILLLALVAIGIFSMLIALFQNIHPGPPFWDGWKQFRDLSTCNFYQFFSLSTDSCNQLYKEVSRDGSLLFIYVVRTIAIALLVSVMLLKLLSQKNLFVQRKTICLAPCEEHDLENPQQDDFWEKGGGWELRCRFYNGTWLTLLNLGFNAKLRQPTIRENDWSLQNNTLTLATKTWAVALPYVPLSIRIGLDKQDLDMEESNDKILSLKTIQGHPFEPELGSVELLAKSFLVINITGTIDESDSNLLESLWWRIADKSSWHSQGREKPVNVEPGSERLATGSRPGKWAGWEDFEEGEIDSYVFGYGSLMAEWLGDEGSHIANLRGFERDWKATMDNKIVIPGYKIYGPDDASKRKKYVSFLNISKKKDATLLTGVLKKHSLRKLAELDRRERNYLRIEVTDSIDFICPDQEQPARPYTVWTYTASKAARDRHKLSQGQSVASKEYLDRFKEASALIAERVSKEAEVNFDIIDEIWPLELQKQTIDK